MSGSSVSADTFAWGRLVRAATNPSNLFKNSIGWLHARDLKSQFGIIAGIVITIGMTSLGIWVSERIQRSVVQHSADSAALYLSSFVAPLVQSNMVDGILAKEAHDNIDALLASSILGDDVVDIKVWGLDGRLLYSEKTKQIGAVFPITDELRGAFAGKVEAEYEDIADESEFESELKQPLLGVYMPVRSGTSGNIIAVVEIYSAAGELAKMLQWAKFETALIVAAFGFAMLVSLFHIVQRGSRTIAAQQKIMDSRVVTLSRLLNVNKELQRNLSRFNQLAAENNEDILRRIGADLHDGPLQLLGFVMLRLETLNCFPQTSNVESGNSDFDVVRGALRDTVCDLRHISYGLMLPELDGADVGDALRIAVRNHVRLTGTTVEVCIDDDFSLKLPRSVITCLYRFAQEGLNNAMKHADGQGQKVSAQQVADTIVVEVADRGPGIIENEPDGGEGRLGLRGLEYRISSLGGELEYRARRGGGTHLIARFPLDSGR